MTQYYTELCKSNTNANNCHKVLKLTHTLYNDRYPSTPQYLYTKHKQMPINYHKYEYESNNKSTYQNVAQYSTKWSMRVHFEFCACPYCVSFRKYSGCYRDNIQGDYPKLLLKVIWLLWQKRHTFLASTLPMSVLSHGMSTDQ
jgi:hypothetical protein